MRILAIISLLFLAACVSDNIPYGIPPGYDAATVVHYRQCYNYNLNFKGLNLFAAIDGCTGDTVRKATCVCRDSIYQKYREEHNDPVPSQLDFEIMGLQ